MTPKEHYIRAEEIMVEAMGHGYGDLRDSLVAAAQVHAILATTVNYYGTYHNPSNTLPETF